MRIEVVLFDADGVIQKRPRGWRDALGERLGFGGDPSDFLAGAFRAEDTALEGKADFTQALSHHLAQWNCRATLEEALQVWTMLEVDSEITDAIRHLRQHGVSCHLASNQEPYKARYMSEVLGYNHLFEREFYSCDLGAMKPNEAYFRAIVNALKCPPERILFIDDRQRNVDSARQVGLYASPYDLASGRGELDRILDAHGLSFA